MQKWEIIGTFQILQAKRGCGTAPDYRRHCFKLITVDHVDLRVQPKFERHPTRISTWDVSTRPLQ